MMFYNFSLEHCNYIVKVRVSTLESYTLLSSPPCFLLFPEEKKDMSSSLQQRLKIVGVHEGTTGQCMF